MKKLLVFAFLFVSISINAQYQVWTFVKAVPGENFDKLLKEEISTHQKNRLDSGVIKLFHVWKAYWGMDENQTFSHILIQGYGKEIGNWTKKPHMKDTFENLSINDFSSLQKKIGKSRKIIGRMITKNVSFYNNLDSLPKSAVINFYNVNSGMMDDYKKLHKGITKETFKNANNSKVAWMAREVINPRGRGVLEDINYLTIDFEPHWTERYNPTKIPSETQKIKNQENREKLMAAYNEISPDGPSKIRKQVDKFWGRYTVKIDNN
tara:strand:+ start:340 stop:1134 length:795 start_codon:yes stop_codon:yes gene_type:complete